MALTRPQAQARSQGLTASQVRSQGLAYSQAVALLDGSLRSVIRPGLKRISALLDRLGNPHQGWTGVLVGGTNGKGSVCAMVDSMCRAAGLHSLRLTSPHLTSYRERIVIDGAEIDEARFARLVERAVVAADAVAHVAGRPTTFELLTAVSALAAVEVQPDVIVCEIGMGGLYDSNNMFSLGTDVITNVSLDHTNFLGNTIAEVATEKAGIIKPGDVVVTAAVGEALAIIEARAREEGADLVVVGRDIVVDVRSGGVVGGNGGVRGGDGDGDGDGVVAGGGGSVGVEATISAYEAEYRVWTPLNGVHQAGNLALAVGACLTMRRAGIPIPDEAVVKGAAAVNWPGRLQWMEGDPPLLLDGAHNPAGIDALVAAVRAMVPPQRPRAIVFGVMADKDVDAMVAGLRELGLPMVTTGIANVRGLSATELAGRWGDNARVAATLGEALAVARDLADGPGSVLVCGSLHLVGEVLDLLAESESGDG